MRNHSLIKIFFSLICAVFAGWITGPDSVIFGVPFVKIYDLLGQLFLNALKLIIVPLVCASLITGVAKMGGDSSVGRLGTKTLGVYLLISLLAVLTGLGGFGVIASTISPSPHFSNAIGDLSNMAISSQESLFDRIVQILHRLIPANIFAAASEGQMLGLLFFSLLFGSFIPKIDSRSASIVLSFWEGIFAIMMKITHFVMRALPLGVFGLVAKVVAETGFDAMTSVGIFSLGVIGSILFFSLVIIPILLVGIGGIHPFRFFRTMAPALVAAFSTSSSAATLPLIMECLEKRGRMSQRICHFAIPLGSCLSMSGIALYLCLASLFIVKMYGLPLSIVIVSLLVGLSLLTSFGIAGIPSASLLSLLVILQMIGVPPEGIGILMVTERVLDMFRTTLNVLGNSTCAALLARSEGEEHLFPSEQPLDVPVNKYPI